LLLLKTPGARYYPRLSTAQCRSTPTPSTDVRATTATMATTWQGSQRGFVYPREYGTGRNRLVKKVSTEVGNGVNGGGICPEYQS